MASNPLVIPPARAPSEAELQESFAKYDTNRDGVIDASELLHLLRDCGLTDLEEDEVEHMMERLDLDGNGAIDFPEFVLFYNSVLADDEHRGSQKDPSQTPQSPSGKKRTGSHEAYLTDKKKLRKQRIYELMYLGLPSFPPDYTYRRWWDIMVSFLILYLFVVASTMAVMAIPPTLPMVVLDIVVTVLLLADILVTLNTAVVVDSSTGLMAADRRDICSLYFRSGMLLVDFVSMLPLDIVVWMLTEAMLPWRILRCLRLLKLLKFPTLFVMTDRGTMDPPFVRFYFWTVPLLKISFKMAFAGHLLTLGRMVLSPQDESCRDFGMDACVSSIISQYLYAAWWNWALLTTQGLAAIENGAVHAYAALVMLLSLLLQGHVVAKMSALFLRSNIREQNQDSMRSTLAIMDQYGIPQSLQQEVLSFQYHCLQQNAASGFAHILEKLPAPMQREVGLYVKVELVAKVPMFEMLSNECKLELANCLEQTYSEPDCFIIEYGQVGREMYFLMHGFADVIVPAEDGSSEGKVVATVKRGDFFGEIALLKPDQIRSASIQALSYCDLFQLSYTDFSKMMSEFEELRLVVEAEAKRRGLMQDDTTSSAPTIRDLKNVLKKSRGSVLSNQGRRVFTEVDRRKTLLLASSSAQPSHESGPALSVPLEIWGVGSRAMSQMSHRSSSERLVPLSPKLKKRGRASGSSPPTGSFPPTSPRRSGPVLEKSDEEHEELMIQPLDEPEMHKISSFCGGVSVPVPRLHSFRSFRSKHSSLNNFKELQFEADLAEVARQAKADRRSLWSVTEEDKEPPRVKASPRPDVEARSSEATIEDRLMLEVRILRRVHLCEERLRKQMWEHQRITSDLEAKVARLSSVLERVEARVAESTNSSDFGGLFRGFQTRHAF
eukprot:Sspe_Gene.27947::Locus_12397_Transcript_1_1_Confidence_1.000_Length_2929::g.27947::m.27947